MITLGTIDLSTISSLATKVEPYLDVITSALDDPAFPAVIARIRTIRSLAESEAAVTASAPTAKVSTAAPAVGLGLNKFVTPLDYYIYFRKNKAATYVGIAAVLLLPLGIGFMIGRLSKKSCKAVEAAV